MSSSSDRVDPLLNSIHIYVSTYCQHNDHDHCRHTCKVCQAPCRCPCHDVIVFDLTEGEVRRG